MARAGSGAACRRISTKISTINGIKRIVMTLLVGPFWLHPASVAWNHLCPTAKKVRDRKEFTEWVSQQSEEQQSGVHVKLILINTCLCSSYRLRSQQKHTDDSSLSGHYVTVASPGSYTCLHVQPVLHLDSSEKQVKFAFTCYKNELQTKGGCT